MINFIHQGEVTVSDEDLIYFLDVAKDLNVTGLSSEDRESCTPISPRYELPENTDEVLTINQGAKGV